MHKLLLIVCFALLNFSFTKATSVSSPDGKISVSVDVKDGKAQYRVLLNGSTVLEPSILGIVAGGRDFSSNLRLISTSAITTVADDYTMVYAKKRSIRYRANKRVFTFSNDSHQKFQVIFQVSNDGVAFRYRFLGGPETSVIQSESTTYNFPGDARAFVQPVSVAKSGWEQTNPSYEEHYYQDVPVGTFSKLGAGFVYPALFKSGEAWVLITETAVESNWCGTRLDCTPGSSEYHVAFPDPREVIFDKNLLPLQPMNGFSPWRVMAIGSLKTIVESTLGTDLAVASRVKDAGFVKPGKASWSWINSKDDFIVYDEQRKYIDFAATMKWQYCLVDVNWDWKIGMEKMQQLVDCGRKKGVGIIVWYNSAGNWNTVKYTPKDKLLTKESREKEFAMLQAMGIKGVKIDFFGGDGQSVMAYYHDILKDAARYRLMVNFHGATLPRGWSRTYPHLVTVEAVKGFEFITFGQADADLEANHCAMLPFTRNVFDPMDFTPMNLYKINTRVLRKTTAAFELATSVLFLSGVQHFAESPEGMAHVPGFAKHFLRNLPNHWDEVKFIDGYPGKSAVIARRSGSKWYVAGINGESVAKKLSLDLSFLKRQTTHLMNESDTELLQLHKVTITPGRKVDITLAPSGGFVLVTQ